MFLFLFHIKFVSISFTTFQHFFRFCMKRKCLIQNWKNFKNPMRIKKNWVLKNDRVQENCVFLYTLERSNSVAGVVIEVNSSGFVIWHQVLQDARNKKILEGDKTKHRRRCAFKSFRKNIFCVEFLAPQYIRFWWRQFFGIESYKPERNVKLKKRCCF